MYTYIVIIVICIIFSAYFSATETAFSSLNKTRMKTFAEKGNKRAKLALKLSDNYDKLISTILIGNNIVNILASSVATVLFIDIFTKMNKPDIGPTVSTIVLTVVILIFGEISPKSIAKDNPEKFAMFSSPLIRVFMVVLTPVIFIFTAWKKLLSKIFKFENDNKTSQEELLMFVDEVEQEGAIDTDESDLIKNAIEFTDRKAEDILTHRVDIEAVSDDATNEEIEELFRKTQFSRLLVYKDTVDDIIGVIHLKDYYTSLRKNKSIKSIITEPVFIQKSEKISDILKILQSNKAHMAVVVDEYGGTLGIVTMEDILEELVGEIWDEHDEVVEDYKLVDENKYIVDASVNFDDFCEYFDIEAEADSVSVGGWVMEQLGRIAENGDEFSFGKLDVTVLETDSHRVTSIQVIVNEIVDLSDDE